MKSTVILCAPGTTSVRGRRTLAGLTNAVRREAQDLEVVDAFASAQVPAIADVVKQTSGPRAVIPLMLAHDMRVGMSIARASREDSSVTITEPLGPDWSLAEIGVQRLVEAGARADDTIILAAGGPTSAQAAEDLGQAAQLLSAVWGGRVHVGQLGGHGVPLADAIDVARAYGKRVVVSTYVLGHGAVFDEISVADVDLVTAPLLDGGPPDPRLVALVVDRAKSRAVRT